MEVKNQKVKIIEGYSKKNLAQNIELFINRPDIEFISLSVNAYGMASHYAFIVYIEK